MALSETSFDSATASQTVAKRYSNGPAHSQQIKKALQGKRLAGKHVRPAIDRLARALNSESDAVAVQAANSLLDRALGKPASDPQDSAIAGMAAAAFLAAMPADFLPQLLNMRHAALQQQPLDITLDATPALPQERK